ncbi:MAG: 16S rRNA (guanine(527)-N(7))-methyltransferase RsmG, partial [Acholeplasmataceae bacterium]|nr:16S rRNA (guanine(527)-N(7))-methyltransferase RsmG [Acholeplasmataceae bacterium]
MVLDFSERLAGLGLKANNETLEKFDIYYRYLISENEVMNLTSITKREDVYNKHFLDSLMLTRAFDPNDKTLLDIGSGAGFPSLPLKLFFPSLKVTVIEATGKKVGFLERLVGKLGFDDVTLLNIRAEDYEMKEAFQIVTARAVAKLNILAELALPFVKKNGLFVAMKN